MLNLLQEFQKKMIAVHTAEALGSAGKESLKKADKQLETLMTMYMSPERQGKMHKLKNQLSEATSEVSEAMDAALQRSARCEDIEKDTGELADTPSAFAAKSKEARKKAWWQMAKMWIAGTLLAILILG